MSDCIYEVEFSQNNIVVKTVRFEVPSWVTDGHDEWLDQYRDEEGNLHGDEDFDDATDPFEIWFDQYVKDNFAAELADGAVIESCSFIEEL
jgi:hypothetical protein